MMKELAARKQFYKIRDVHQEEELSKVDEEKKHRSNNQ